MGLLSEIYSFALRCRRFHYDHIRSPKRLPAKVASIGNLTLGGTGKTPAVIGIALKARERGCRPCVLTRGYKGRAKNICFVSRGEGPVLDCIRAGDEAYLMAGVLEGIPVVKGKDRYEAGHFAVQNLAPQPSLFILDDGFQHWNLHRDADVVLIDATNPFGNGKVFPEGGMREPYSALKRADIITITKADVVDADTITSIKNTIRNWNGDAPIFISSHVPSSVTDAHGKTAGLDTLRDKKVYAFAGIANHTYFQASLRSAGADIVEFRKFRDHHMYSQKDIDTIQSDSMGLEIVTTEKDLVKLGGLKLPDRLRALKIAFSIDDDFYEHLFRVLRV